MRCVKAQNDQCKTENCYHRGLHYINFLCNDDADLHFKKNHSCECEHMTIIKIRKEKLNKIECYHK